MYTLNHRLCLVCSVFLLGPAVTMRVYCLFTISSFGFVGEPGTEEMDTVHRRRRCHWSPAQTICVQSQRILPHHAYMDTVNMSCTVFNKISVHDSHCNAISTAGSSGKHCASACPMIQAIDKRLVIQANKERHPSTNKRDNQGLRISVHLRGTPTQMSMVELKNNTSSHSHATRHTTAL